MIYLKFRKTVNNLKKVSLTHSERSVLRSDFFARAGISAETNNVPEKTGFYNYFFYLQSFRVGLAACLFIVASGGMVVFASTYSLPGETLYMLKLKVEEPIVRAFRSVSPSAKADYELQLVEERLHEAEKLNSNGSLTADQKNTIKTRVVEQSARAKKAIESDEIESEVANFNSTEVSDTSEKSFKSKVTVATTTIKKIEKENNKERLQKILIEHQNILNEIDEDDWRLNKRERDDREDD